jgi:hypothetical protein
MAKIQRERERRVRSTSFPLQQAEIVSMWKGEDGLRLADSFSVRLLSVSAFMCLLYSSQTAVSWAEEMRTTRPTSPDVFYGGCNIDPRPVFQHIGDYECTI